MLLNVITTYLFLGAAVGHLVVPRSEVNGPCTGSGGAPGVCIATADCTKGGGSFVSNKCPGTPEDIKCCTKTACGTDNKGICRFVSSCASGNTETNKCSGPTDFRCCMPGSGNGNYPPPGLPTTSQGCKQTAIDGAKKIVSAFPGKIIEIGCKRNCADPSSSDHCTGMANDLMVAKYGSKTDAGQPIAEWVMNNRAGVKCKYAMWGQRIWEKSRDSVKPWNQWRYQACTKIPNCVDGNRGSNTDNHWDHVHVSYAT